MDRVLSARLDEAIVHRISTLARHLHTSKKRVIEDAVLLYAGTVDERAKIDVFEETCGAWKRKESATELVRQARRQFDASMTRHHR